MNTILKGCFEALTMGHLISVRRSKGRASSCVETQLKRANLQFPYLQCDIGNLERSSSQWSLKGDSDKTFPYR